uniref:ATP-dependent RNA helicase n=1 Tax=Geotrypetes seraphini TaxID=260995 RepID=A0A6P8SE72_GEOSA|nr:probable ATP-dependent RNA helicase DDX31 [Geotrypetes seraphini]XP_033816525.1 probable ATP-dependent RNA helicase DDX31 [Geotrypetes seraphini]XP_033816526.1 probable ATP-dependent RNA helicase DDX31 [Geotrypetes seraphini]XP_033816527.1 probable ATP-dependent RNA helicase DDX31 [Geotrypetes seraphini]XP_033816528.1 probable ATP-dependent RNA helicase DDX31 [Geotrypetes seraphini]XP_033816529.1 probable ATP-dependent RNA helicase DDX31 [Geotrypetes seraphini]
MDDEGLILNITENSRSLVILSRQKRSQTQMYRPQTKWLKQGPKTVKRKPQEAAEGPSPKRKAEALFSPVKAVTKDDHQRFLKRKPAKESSPREHQNKKREENQEERPFIKTSSLFKNNPEIPEINRPAVKQTQEKVFTSDLFSELDLHPHLVSTITRVLKMTKMTSVQKLTIPAFLAGRDIMVRSQTGSGKTLAYSIPLVQILQGIKPKIQRSNGPYALILVPTRELALQSFGIFQKLLKPFTWIVPGVLMGGEKKKSEKARLRKGINILISTPGRLVDHIRSTRTICFNRVQWLLVDEADRMLDLGFEKDVTVILNTLNKEHERRQNIFLSATLTEGVTRLADISLQDPMNITVTEEAGGETPEDKRPGVVCGCPSTLQASVDKEHFAVPETLTQHIVVVPSKLRLVTLAAFILGKFQSEKSPKLIVFFSTCELVEFHHTLFTNVLTASQQRAGSQPLIATRLEFLRLHGNMEQEERTEVFLKFSQSSSSVLLCTDVAARGLDIPQVTWIVQYNAPCFPTEYIHRIGRTARIGSQGNSLLVLAPSEVEYINSLAAYNISVSEVKMEDILSSLLMNEHFKARRQSKKKSSGAGPQEVRERATVLQTAFEDYVHAAEENVIKAKKALQSFIRSYATYPQSLKHIFHVKSLHLGHIAKSFGLRDAPQNLNFADPTSPKRSKKPKPKRSTLYKKNSGKQCLRDMLCSEYASGLRTKGLKARKANKTETQEQQT